ncbi:glycosyltransferase family 2 protein [Agarivorans sp. 1_MG-2023]|uniref:glycosyltransferase family 2 protein n=1 Tax=Agarivorans sp. 1_MG-2023 TaxID=3062634 RepID=UPI0026E1A95D|nr:glycosyltransferase family 2 protein [Agarivorans sp. 1_MG-2023]MDO6764817.1 glycosyltransferase family 2 protein [Agarivorans sp. 1_MG-2023]
MQVDVVIVNWNSKKLLEKCVDSLLLHGGEELNNIVVIDNASSDNSLAFLTKHPQVLLFSQEENLGFAKACNIGAAHCSAEYILFLNPDAEVFEGTLQRVTAFMSEQQNHRIGVCGVQLIDESGLVARSCSRTATFSGLIMHAVGLDRKWPSLGQAMRDWNHLNDSVVDQVIGAFYFVRRDLFVQLEGFDERFFVYYEEVDFAYRAKQKGYSSYFLASERAFHEGGGTSNQVKAARLFYSLRSRLQYSFKHFHWFKASIITLVSIIIEPLMRCLLCVSRKDLFGVKETLLAYKNLLKWYVTKGER